MEGMARENSSVPPSSPSLLGANTTCFLGGSKTLIVDSYAIGFLV